MQPSLHNFFEDDRPPAEIERQKRICVALWAWAYEKHSDPLVSDAKFDKVCSEIDTKVDTGNKVLDNFFKKKFGPETGQWVHSHPEKAKLEALYQRLNFSRVLHTIQQRMSA
jgi:hypothetical protein